jgi:drug/metabolite transporter (DMT)-like permease
MLRKFKADAVLVIVAAIWGFAFVAQRLGMDHLGPFGFNAARFFIGALSLIPLLWLFKPTPGHKPLKCLKYGVLAGVILFLGASLQQYGLQFTTAANAGFITGFYIILVPMIGFFLKQSISKNTWAGALCAVSGLYLLSVTESFHINPGDAYQLLGALFWALHVVVIGYFASRIDNLRLAITQFVTCATLCSAVAILFESTRFTMNNALNAYEAILFAGVLSVGIAYTLQIVAQKSAPASHAAVIMSLEAAFAALGGWLFLDEAFTSRTLLGCTLMLTGMIISQLPEFKRKRVQTEGRQLD